MTTASNYQLVFDREKGCFIADEAGIEVSEEDARSILKALETRYLKMITLYIGESASEIGLYKIGVSNDVHRRARELGIWIRHTIPCSYKAAWELERSLHNFLGTLGLHSHGEWFYLQAGEDDFLKKLCTLKTEADVWHWMRVIEDKYGPFELLGYGYRTRQARKSENIEGTDSNAHLP